MTDKSKKVSAQSLLSIELEMEKANRYATEKLLQEKEREINHLKSLLHKDKPLTPYMSGADMLQTISFYLQVGILIENESGLVVSINRSFCNLLHLNQPIDTLIGTDLLQTNAFNAGLFSNPFYFQQRTNEILSGRSEVRQDAIELKDGMVIERDYIPLFDGDQYHGHIWFYYDATDKYNLEKKLAKQKDIYESILSYLPADIAVLKPAFADLFLNPIAIKDNDLRQWIIEWLIGKKNKTNITSSNVDSNNNSYHALFQRVMTEKKGGQIEEKKMIENGDTQYLLKNLTPILDDDGELNMVIGYHTDITERVKIEEELTKAKQATEELAKAKDLFLANVSHEIRTPMNGILGIVNLLGKTNLDSQQKKLASMIHEAASNLLVIVNDILNLEKITAGKLELEEVPFLIVDKCQILVDSFQFKAKEKQLELTFDNDLPTNLTLLGDPYRLTQIMNNLIGNAIKFTNKGSIQIMLSAITENEQDIWIKCSVKDSGIGIDPTQIAQLFEPYKQAESSTTRKYGGTGLGLSISKKLVELMGGRIAVESNPNKGATFSFTLPFKKNLTPTVVKKINTNFNQLKGCRVLLAEDVEMNQLIARSILEEKGIYVTIASDGKEVIEKVEQYQFDLILMDISMPFIDGIQATSIIRSMKDPKKNNIPIIALTANALNGDKKKYQDAGMNGFIGKPFLEQPFLTAMLQALQKDNFVIIEDPVKPLASASEKLYNEATIMGMGRNNPAFIQKMIGLFLKTMPADMSLVESAASSQDWKLVERTAHRMKSAIRSMGISIAIEPIKTIEEMAQMTEVSPDILQNIQEINGMLAQVIAQLKSDYPDIVVPK